MGVERYVIEAVVRDGRSHREVARSAGVSKAWVNQLARALSGGWRRWPRAAFPAPQILRPRRVA
jgi:transposase